MATPDSTPTKTDTGRRSTGDDPLSTWPAANVIRLVVRTKSWLAYPLAVCWPGAGHFYRRQWTRGCSWAALYGAALLFLSSATLLSNGQLTEPVLITALQLETVAFGDMAMPFAVLILSVIDLYARAVLNNSSESPSSSSESPPSPIANN